LKPVLCLATWRIFGHLPAHVTEESSGRRTAHIYHYRPTRALDGTFKLCPNASIWGWQQTHYCRNRLRGGMNTEPFMLSLLRAGPRVPRFSVLHHGRTKNDPESLIATASVMVTLEVGGIKVD
jgi:hypothetical protein